MNERILKLARKTGATINEGYDGTKSFVYGITMSPEELDKFAELIVRGCADYITEYYDSRDEAYYMKKHFGVEE